MSKDVKIRRGVDIKLKGIAEKLYDSSGITTTEIALKPSDFPTLVPKLTVKVGDKVKAGSPLFCNKENEKMLFTSPVSGEVIDVIRGEKRKIEEVRVKADAEIKYISFKTGEVNSLSKEGIIDNLLKSGVWPFIRQRPFDVIANPEDSPKAIHITAFDSSPLAPDYDFLVHNNGDLFQLGIDVLAKLVEGKIHLNVCGNNNPDIIFKSAKGVQVNNIFGPHPAGNVGVQAHRIDPVNKGEAVWVLRAIDVLTIGRLFAEGKYDASRIVALTGSQVSTPKYYKTIIGSKIDQIVKNNTKEGNNRYISGNVLTGTKISQDGYLGFYDYQITVLPEGGEAEFFGWMMPGFKKFSLSKTFFSWLMPGKKYELDTNIHGEERAFVVTGEYEKVFPMNIYPVQLLKSILVEDIDAMENLGIYEVAPEDFALCEFACTSKIEVQEIVRTGLNMVKKEVG